MMLNAFRFAVVVAAVTLFAPFAHADCASIHGPAANQPGPGGFYAVTCRDEDAGTWAGRITACYRNNYSAMDRCEFPELYDPNATDVLVALWVNPEHPCTGYLRCDGKVFPNGENLLADRVLLDYVFVPSMPEPIAIVCTCE